MDPGTIIRIAAMCLLALPVLWLLAASIGLGLGTRRLDHRTRDAEPGALLCGACGHPAVALGSIEHCPECGAAYARVGLDAPAPRARSAPPLIVLAAMLVGLGTLASLEFSPRAAQLVNSRTIGTTHIELWQSRAALLPFLAHNSGGSIHPIAVEFHRELIGPTTTPSTVSPNTAIGGRFTMRFAVGVHPNDARSQWFNAPMVQATTSQQNQSSWLGQAAAPSNLPPNAGTLPSPWAPMQAGHRTLTLRWDMGSEAWTLADSAGVTTRGRGLNSGLGAAFGLCGIDPAEKIPGLMAPNLYESLRDTMDHPLARSLGPIRSGQGSTHYIGSISLIDELAARPTTHLLHSRAPWSIAAFAAVPGLCLLLSMIFLWLAWRRGRGGASRLRRP